MKADFFVFLYPLIILIQLPLSVFTGIDEGKMMLFAMDIVVFIYMNSTHKLFRTLVKDKVSLLWLVLIIYHFINSVYQGVPFKPGYSRMFMDMFDAYLMMLMCAFCYITDKDRYLRYMLYGFSIFLLLCLFTTEVGDKDRLVGSINATQIGQIAGCAMMIVFLAKALKRINMVRTILFSVLPVTLLLLSASRNGLLVFLLAVIVFILTDLINSSKSKKILTVFIAVPAFLGIYYLMTNTLVGERMLGTTSQSEEYHLETGTIWDSFGDRGVYYVYGWQLFRTNPIFGIGLWNFRNLSPLQDIPLHSEYMVHICEGGIIAALLYLSIILRLLKRSLLYNKNNKNSESIFLLFFLISYLGVAFSARLFFYPHFYALLGPVLSTRYQAMVVES